MNENDPAQTDFASVRSRRFAILYTWAKRILPIILPLMIIALLLGQVSLQEVSLLFSKISYPWILLGFGIYLLTNIFRAWRTQTLLPNVPVSFGSLVSVMLAQSMFNNTLPGRAGELSFIYLLRKHQNINLDKATVALIISRVADYVAVAVLFIIAALLSVRRLPPYAVSTIGLVLVALVVTIVGVLSALWLGKRLLAFVRLMLIRLGLNEQRWVKFGLSKGEEVITAFEAIHTVKRYAYVMIWSIVIWVCTFGWFYAFLRGVEIQPAATSMVVGSTFAVLSKAIPFISIGGLGAHEAGWTVGYLLIGFDRTTAILSGFAVNLLTLLTSVILGPVGLLVLRWQAKGRSGVDNSPSKSSDPTVVAAKVK